MFCLSWYQDCIYPVIPNKRAWCGSIVGVCLFLVWSVLVFRLWRHTSVCPAVCSRCSCFISTVTFSRLLFNCGHIMCLNISSHLNAGLMLTNCLRRWPNIKIVFVKRLCLLGGTQQTQMFKKHSQVIEQYSYLLPNTLLAQAGKVGWPSGT